MNYIDKINAVRTAKSASIRKLSHSCDLSEMGLKKILHKKSIPSISSIEKICAALDISLADLFCNNDEIVIRKSTPTMHILNTFGALSAETQNRLLWIADKLKGL